MLSSTAHLPAQPSPAQPHPTPSNSRGLQGARVCFSAADCGKRASTHNLDWHAGVVRLLCKVALPIAQLPVRAVAWGVAVAEVAVHQLAEPSAQIPTTLTHQASPASPQHSVTFSAAALQLPPKHSSRYSSPAQDTVQERQQGGTVQCSAARSLRGATVLQHSAGSATQRT